MRRGDNTYHRASKTLVKIMWFRAQVVWALGAILLTRSVWAVAVRSTSSYNLCNLTDIDPLQPSFQSSTCQFYTRIHLDADAGRDVTSKIPTVSVVGNPAQPSRFNTGGNSLTECANDEICTITTPIDVTIHVGEVFARYNLRYAGFSLPWSYANGTVLNVGGAACTKTGAITNLGITVDNFCDAPDIAGDPPPTSCPSSGGAAVTCPATHWERTLTSNCFRMCCNTDAAGGEASYFVWREDVRQSNAGDFLCRAYRPYSQGVLYQVMDIEVDNQTDTFSSGISDTSAGTDVSTIPDPFNPNNPANPLNGRAVIRRIKQFPPIDAFVQANEQVAGALVVICDDIQETSASAQAPSCTSNPPRRWFYIPSPWSSRYGTDSNTYGAEPYKILNEMAQSGDVCRGLALPSEFVPGLALDPDPPDAAITDKFSPSLCDMFAQTQAGKTFWLPPGYDPADPNWWIDDSALFTVLDPAVVGGITVSNAFVMALDLTTNIMAYDSVTAPGFFDPNFSNCYVTSYTNSSRDVATGITQVRVCNVKVEDDETVTQAYTITYVCDPRMTLDDATKTTDPLAVGRCQVVNNGFTFEVDQVQLQNMSLDCTMFLSPGGNTAAGQTSTVCNQFPGILLFDNRTCSPTDLSCFTKDGKLYKNPLFWFLVIVGTAAIIIFIVLIVYGVQQSKQEVMTPKEAQAQRLLDTSLAPTADEQYSSALLKKIQ